MSEEQFYCREHKPPTPDGWSCLPNLRAEKRCQQCGEIALLVLFQKPLAYPRLNNA